MEQRLIVKREVVKDAGREGVARAIFIELEIVCSIMPCHAESGFVCLFRRAHW